MKHALALTASDSDAPAACFWQASTDSGQTILTGQALTFDISRAYILSLLFLALFGSALAFGAYLTLMGRIGADRAAYTAIAIPIVALLLSTAFENLRWQLETVSGLVACLGGIALALRRRARPQE